MELNLVKIIDRIKELKKVSGDQEVADLLGMSRTALAERKRRESIPYDELVIFSDREGVLIDWLLTGEGEMRRTYQTERGIPLSVSERASPIYNEKEFVFVPQMAGEISAGGGLIPDNTIEMRIAFRREWIQRKGDPHNMSLIRVSGDSMDPTLVSGDLVLIDHNRNVLDPQGGIYAISMDSIIMIKRVQLIYNLNRVRIISDNARYDPLDADPAQVKINGKVIWFGREIER
jgi:phage repressor protein C with HTH and peptisase S24 domain